MDVCDLEESKVSEKNGFFFFFNESNNFHFQVVLCASPENGGGLTFTLKEYLYLSLIYTNILCIVKSF